MSSFSRWARRAGGLIVLAGAVRAEGLRFAVLVSADAEWRVVKPLFPSAATQTSPYGEFFLTTVERERVHRSRAISRNVLVEMSPLRIIAGISYPNVCCRLATTWSPFGPLGRL